MSNRDARPAADVLADLAQAAAQTARAHLCAAKHLLKGKFWPEACAIAATGFEEAGKAWLAVEALLLPEELRKKTLHDLLSDHKLKLGTAYSMLTLVRYIIPNDPVPPDPTGARARVVSLADKAWLSRQRGLFTHASRAGVVSRPADVSEHEAHEMVKEVEEVLDIGGMLVNLSTVKWVKGDIPDEAREALTNAAKAAKAGPAAMEEFIRSGPLDDIRRRVEAVQTHPEFLQSSGPDWLEHILRAAASDAPESDD